MYSCAFSLALKAGKGHGSKKKKKRESDFLRSWGVVLWTDAQDTPPWENVNMEAVDFQENFATKVLQTMEAITKG